MKMIALWRPLLLVMIVCLPQAEGWGASAGDSCLQEEKRLQAEETALCSGLSYVFNPNACFTSRKALAAYSKGKCRDSGVGEGTAAPPPTPVRSAVVFLPVQPATVSFVTEKVPGQPQLLKVSTTEAMTPLMAIEQLSIELSAVKAELRSLQEEVRRLGACQ